MSNEGNSSDDVEIQASFVSSLHMTATATAKTRTNFSVSHIRSATRFEKLLVDVEARHVGAGWGPHWEEARDLATAALILSFCAVEAAVNEAVDDLKIPDELAVLIEKAGTFNGAQALLVHIGATPLDKSLDPAQGLNLLRAIRNALVHAKGEWSDAEGRAYKLSKRIVAAGLPLSPFQSDPNSALERGIMSAGAVKWAIDTACEFIGEFRSKAGLPPLPLRA